MKVNLEKGKPVENTCDIKDEKDETCSEHLLQLIPCKFSWIVRCSGIASRFRSDALPRGYCKSIGTNKKSLQNSDFFNQILGSGLVRKLFTNHSYIRTKLQISCKINRKPARWQKVTLIKNKYYIYYIRIKQKPRKKNEIN